MALDGLYCEREDRFLESIEGTLIRSSGWRSKSDSSTDGREIVLDKFSPRKFIIPKINYRIDVGERVRIFSRNGFKKDNHVHGVQVLADNPQGYLSQMPHGDNLNFRPER